MEVSAQQIHDLAVSLLTQEDGICDEAYGNLRDLLVSAQLFDIIASVDATDGRFYLPDSWDDTESEHTEND